MAFPLKECNPTGYSLETAIAGNKTKNETTGTAQPLMR
jgi:hypothetical protein